MKTIKTFLAWALVIIISIVTLPVSIAIYFVDASEYTWGDYEQGIPPKYFSK